MLAPSNWDHGAVRASASVSERSAAVVQDYVFVPAVSVDAERLLAFDAAVQPERQARDRILASWWTRATPECAVAAIHPESGVLWLDLRRPGQAPGSSRPAQFQQSRSVHGSLIPLILVRGLASAW
jgi:hypothetical protein